MRQLTFKGFLKQYVNELSFCRTNKIRLLADEAPNGNYRLVEPLTAFHTAYTDPGHKNLTEAAVRV